MLLKLKYFFAILFIIAGFVSCSKEYSYEGGFSGGTSSGTAVFILEGSPGSCTTAIVEGNYNVDSTLNNSNTATISVVVDSIGSYTISTNANNGITFTGSGNFTSTGIQNVILTATGKPLAAGTFTFNPGTNSCSFPVIVISGATNHGTGNNNNDSSIAGDYLTCTINGVNLSFNNGVGAVMVSLSGLASSNITGSAANSNASFVINLNNVGTIITGIYGVSTITNITSMFCTVVYIDSAGNNWGVAAKSQTGTFDVQVTSVSGTRIEGTFSGTLYSSAGTGNTSEAVTDGQFSAPIQ